MKRHPDRIEFVGSTGPEPLIDAVHETEHALGRHPFHFWRLIKAY